MLPGLLGPEAPPALVVLVLLDLLHVGRREGLARFQLVEPGSERAQVPDAVLGRVAWGDGIHGAAQTEARGGDGGGGAEVGDRAARTEARGGGGCGGAEIREQAEHDIAVMGMRTRRAQARILASLRPLTRVSARQNMSQMFAN